MEEIYREFPIYSAVELSAMVKFITAHARACIDQNRPLLAVITTADSLRTKLQNKRYFGYLLRHIVEQAWVNGKQFGKLSWHEHFAEEYGGTKEIILPFTGEIKTRRTSTTEMEVAEFSKYMDQVEAFGATELGVVFP